jgi:hypothetical protein
VIGQNLQIPAAVSDVTAFTQQFRNYSPVSVTSILNLGGTQPCQSRVTIQL